MKYDVKQIRVGKYDFGIIGLIDAIKAVAEEHKDAPDDIIAEALVKKLSQDNYISAPARERFKPALLREYKNHFNLPVPVLDEDSNELVVTVVGPGCPRCENLEMEVMLALSELNLPARVDHIRDPKEIGQMGIFGMPALLINREVKCVGSTPSKAQIIEWLKPFKKE